MTDPLGSSPQSTTVHAKRPVGSWHGGGALCCIPTEQMNRIGAQLSWSGSDPVTGATVARSPYGALGLFSPSVTASLRVMSQQIVMPDGTNGLMSSTEA